tara:strand:+ start:184 stop:354 length:171 start_codon:yes stop_codon:yes gene_type:complete
MYKENKIFNLYLDKLKEVVSLRKKESKRLVTPRNWDKLEKKLINGHWWVKSTDALK